MGAVPRMEQGKDDAGALFTLTLDLYTYAGECRRRLLTVTKSSPKVNP